MKKEKGNRKQGRSDFNKGKVIIFKKRGVEIEMERELLFMKILFLFIFNFISLC